MQNSATKTGHRTSIWFLTWVRPLTLLNALMATGLALALGTPQTFVVITGTLTAAAALYGFWQALRQTTPNLVELTFGRLLLLWLPGATALALAIGALWIVNAQTAMNEVFLAAVAVFAMAFLWLIALNAKLKKLEGRFDDLMGIGD